jgi:hypothetical protein
MFSGGADGNEQLTAELGVVLLVLLAALGVTIPDLRGLIAEHLFLGFLLLGPVVAKLGSTGYRFMRYYSGDPAYRRKGPPRVGLRLIAPIVVLSTVVVFGSGIWLLIEGPNHRDPALTVHKLSFVAWLVFMALHVLGHLLDLPRSLRAARETREALPELLPRTGGPTRVSSGAWGRWIILTGATLVGAVAAVALIPSFAPWTAPRVFRHHRVHEAPAEVISHAAAPVTGRIRRPATRG